MLARVHIWNNKLKLLMAFLLFQWFLIPVFFPNSGSALISYLFVILIVPSPNKDTSQQTKVKQTAGLFLDKHLPFVNACVLSQHCLLNEVMNCNLLFQIFLYS